MILLRQKLYANVTPMYLARRVSQGKGSLQNVVEHEKGNLDAVIERYKRLYGGKKPSSRLIKQKLNQIGQSHKDLQREIKYGIEKGIPEQYAERSVLGNIVGQKRVASQNDWAEREGRRFLRKWNRVDELNAARRNAAGWLGPEPELLDHPTFMHHFLEKDKAQEEAAERLKSIMKAREPYLPKSVVDERVSEALTKKRLAAARTEEQMNYLRNHSAYDKRDMAEFTTARTLAGYQTPPTASFVFGPKFLTGQTQSWRGI